ncbi:MAG: addiction module antidote protein, HigA family [Verrucomicrobiaceae bacterium]|nr:MAG: addiction module antidote protein, HigA family [Verrucomicrobiaceae bacterium]
MKAIRKFRFEPDYAVPPGATLKESMESLGLTERELAERTGITVQTLTSIIDGGELITCETANKLELVMGTPAVLWNNLEDQYRLQLARMQPQPEGGIE